MEFEATEWLWRGDGRAEVDVIEKRDTGGSVSFSQ